MNVVSVMAAYAALLILLYWGKGYVSRDEYLHNSLEIPRSQRITLYLPAVV